MLRLSLPSKRNGIADVGLLFQLRLETFTPPRSLLAHFLWFQHKTFGLDDIEEQFAHQVGGRCVGLLQTRTKPVFNCNYSNHFQLQSSAAGLNLHRYSSMENESKGYHN